MYQLLDMLAWRDLVVMVVQLFACLDSVWYLHFPFASPFDVSILDLTHCLKPFGFVLHLAGFDCTDVYQVLCIL